MISKENYAALREEFPGHIMFRVTKGGASRIIIIPPEHADKCGSVFPDWPMRMFHRTTVRLDTKPHAADYHSLPCMSYKPK